MIKSRFNNTIASTIWCFLFLTLLQFTAAANPPSTNCHCVITITSSSSCAGSSSGSATATATDGTAPYTYRWSNGAYGATATGLSSGSYSVTSTDKYGCTATQSVTISSVSLNVDAGANKTICKGSSTQLNATGADLYSWTPTTGLSNASIANPVASPTVTTTYTVTGAVSSGELVTNGNFESGNTGFTSQYSYNSDLYPEGRYYIGSNANNYHYNFFGTGHGGSGKFMIVNGATVAGVKVWNQTVSVTPNTTYYFSTWITALNNGVSANLAFSVNGTLMGPIISSPASPNTWIQFYAVWNSGNATSANISIVNQNTIASGNDFGLDDISFTTVCEKTDQVTVTVKTVGADAGPDVVKCAGLPATLTATGGGTYLWSTGATTASISVNPTSTTTYTVTVTNNGCSESDQVKVIVPTPPSVSLTKTNVSCDGICNGTATAVVSGGQPPYTYAWSNGDKTVTADSLCAGGYVVTITDGNGCTATAATTLPNSTQPCSGQACYQSPDDPNVYVTSLWTINWNTSGVYLTVRTTLSRGFVDNTYGTNAIQWPGNGHSFSQLVGSDHLVLSLYNNAGAESMRLKMDYISSSSTAPSGYACLGVNGGDGQMQVGSASDVVNVNTSLADNFNLYGYVLTTNSPATDTFYTPNPTYPNWIYDVWYEATVKLSAFGSSGFAYPAVTGIHASPSKTGNNSEDVVPGPCCDIVVGATKTDGTCLSPLASATAFATSSYLPITYTWSNGATGATASGLVSDTYVVVATDSAGCKADTSITVVDYNGVNISLQAFDEGCLNKCDGHIELTVSGGVGPYTYAWSNGATTKDIYSLCSGQYSVTVTDAQGCSANKTGTITAAAGPIIALQNTNVYCAGNCEGTIDLTIIQGQAPITFLWSDGSTQQDRTGLCIGQYCVTVTDASGCNTSSCINITEFSTLSVLFNITQPNNMHPGAISTSVYGGTAPYTYQWSNGSTASALTNVASGAYGVTVTDANGVAVSGVAMVNSLNQVKSGAFIVNMGVVPQTIANGLKPYGMVYDLVRNYNVPVKWVINPNKAKDGTDFTYNGTDYKGGPFIIEADYRTPAVDARIAYWQSQGVVGVTTTTDITVPVYDCITGFSNLVVDQQNENLVLPYFSNAMIPSSIYRVGLPSDLNGCDDVYAMPHADPEWSTHQYLRTFNRQYKGYIWSGCHAPSVLEGISNPANPSERMNFLSSNGLKCYNGNKCGSLITESHGNANTPYTYDPAYNSDPIMQFMGDMTPSTENGSEEWYIPLSTGRWNANTSPAITTNNGTAPGKGVKLVYGPGYNDYNFGKVMYEAGHTANGKGPITSQVAAQRAFFNFILTASIDKRLDIVSNIPSTFISGTPQTLSIQVTGGAAPYTYAWTTTCTGTFSSTNTASVTFTPGQAPPQSKCALTVVVTDACGRRTFHTQPIAFLNSPPVKLSATIVSTPVSCVGTCDGTATVTATGGTAPYTYTWSNGATTASLTNLCAGSYSVTVKDQNNCDSVLATVVLSPDTLKGSIVKTDVSCGGGNLPCKVLQYAPGSHAVYLPTLGLASNNWLFGANGGTIETYANGTARIYGNIYLQGDTTKSFYLDFHFSNKMNWAQWSALGRTWKGSAAIVGTNYQNWTYYIFDPNTPSTLTGRNSFVGNNMNIAHYPANYGMGLQIGLAANDKNGGYGLSTWFTYSGWKSGQGDVNALLQCVQGQCDGTADVTVTGGTAPYTYSWNTGATSEDLTALCPGTYTVTVTDSNGCTKVLTTTILEGSELILNATGTNIACAGVCNGTATVSATGGNTPFTYAWSNGATTQSLTGLCAGTYTVTVTDGKGCFGMDTVVITANPKPEITAVATDVNCFGGSTGTVTTTVTGGTSPFTYAWSPSGETTANLANKPAGTYTVILTDVNGCSDTASATITQPADSLNGTTSSTPVSCIGGTDGTASVVATGGTAPYTYAWSTTPTRTTATITGLRVGTYTVTITDSKACNIVRTVVVTGVPPLTLGSVPSPVLCNGGNTGSINLTVSGGTPGYTFQWSNGATTEDISGLTAGTYNVTVTDANGCVATAGVAVTQPQPIVATATPTNVNCNGGSTGKVTLSVTGGTSPFAYAWSNGATTKDLNNIAAGTYSVTITDANSCTATANATVTQKDSIKITPTVTEVSCYGGANGSISTAVTGGTSPFTYAWSNGATTANANGLAAGTYTVTVTDANGCTGTASATVTQPNAALNASVTKTDVNCYGDLTGTADLTVTGGTAPYTYAWSNGATTEDLTGLAAGTYTVTVTDAKACTTTASVTITQPNAALSASATKTDVNCYGDSTGTVTLTASGGTAPYTYAWSNGATTKDLTGLAAGTYTVTVTDTKGCTATTSATVTQPNGALNASAAKTDVNCFGGSNGTITLTVTGGTTAYTYLWSNGATTKDLTGLAIGTYTVTVTDAKACTTTASATITQPADSLNGTTSSTPVSCIGGTDGTATVVATGGTAPYTYAWSTIPTRTTATITGLRVGAYSVTITDAKGCIIVRTVTVTGVPPLTLGSVPTPVLCNGGNTGSINLTVSGGTPGYTFQWSNGATTEDISGLTAGTYNVTVTDANGCVATAGVTVGEPQPLVATATPQHIACFGANTGGVTLSVVGGASLFTYAWSNGATTKDISGLTAGTYTVTITDKNNCTATASASVNQQAALTVTATPTDVTCYGFANGSIATTVGGGVAPYTYNWGGNITTANRSNLAPGTYSVTVTDANNCTGTATATITQPADSLNGTTSSTPVSCVLGTDGTASVVATGGTAPYTYAWSTTPTRTTATITGLRVGTYTVTITDANACNIVRTVIVTGVPPLTVGSVPTPVLCNGGNTGSINLTVNGGTPGYTFLWSNGDTTEDISGLTAGSYNVTVTDANGCVATAGVTITEPQPLVATATPQHIACFGGNTGSVTLSVVGGASPFTYAWSNGATTKDITGLTAGTYSVTVTDKNNCTATASATVTQQPALVVNVTGNNLGCYNNNSGNATASVSGGVAPYTYLWSNNSTASAISNLPIGTYSVTVTDANNCTGTGTVTLTQPDSLEASISASALACYGDATANVTLLPAGGTAPYTYLWNTGATTQNLTNLGAGTYTVTITDANGCTLVKTAVVTQPNLLVATATPLHIACNGAATGGANLAVIGGTLPYTYLWSTGDTTQNLSGVTAGSYSVTITDANGCSDTASATINQQAALQVIATPINITCYGFANGSITTFVNGGVAPYTYNWGSGVNTANLSNLSPGTYTVTVSDANNCTGTASATITQPADSLDATTSSTPVSCIGGTDGTATVVATGGTAPYTYAWSTTPVRTSSMITGLRVGTYTVTITDANACNIVRTVIVTGVPPLTLGSVPTPVLCNGGNTGSINLTVSGGTPGYSFLWSNGATTEDISGLTAGNYNVTVTDANGCIATAGVNVTQPQPLVATATPQHIACFGGNTGSVSLSVVGGSSPFTYAWSNGATTKDLSGLTAGTYSVTITDKNNCTATASATVNQQSALSVTVTGTDLTCYANRSGSATATVNGGVAPYTYAWSNGGNTASLINLPIGTYSVTVTDANGCTGTGSATISQPDTLTATATGSAVGCFGNTTGTVTLSVTGGTTAYTYAWSNGDTTKDLSGLGAGSYTVTVTDANGCTASASATVTQPALLTAAATGSAVSCFGDATGTVTLTVTGGTTAYSYAWSNGGVTKDLSGLAAGTYTVTVTDANGCTATASATVTEPTLLTATGTSTNVLCNGGANASTTLTVSGGTSPYTYAWSNGATTQNLANLGAGTYSVTVTDANGCTATKSFTITQPAGLTASASAQDVRCFLGSDGSANSTVTGGVGPYTYRWSNNATTANLTALRAGSYTVTVTDANGCTATATAVVGQPGPLTLGGVPSPVLCNGGSTGSINLTTTGGVAPYSFIWSNGATTEDISNLTAGMYNVTVTDANNCVATVGVNVLQPAVITLSFVGVNVTTNGGSNGSIDLSVVGGTSPFTYAWSNGATTQDLNNIPAGNYCVTVTDVNGCTATGCKTITEPACTGFSAAATGTNVNCNGGNSGTATLTITGGRAPYTYAWSNGATTQNLTGLAAGTYTVTVTDSVRCVATANVTITQPATLAAAAIGTSPLCSGQSNGSIALNVSGGTAPYTYAWSNGATTQNLNTLTGGTYSVIVTDANGCTATAAATITIPLSINIAPVVTQVRCFLGNDGAVSITVTGGTSPYTYRWSNNATTRNITALRAGSYTVTVTDANGCTATSTSVVTQPGPLTLGGVPSPVSCYQGNDGSINLTATGGTAPYTYAWSNGATTEDISGLAAGTYNVTVTDARGCVGTVSVTVLQPAAIVLSANVTDACAGGNSGALQLNVVGGTSPYTYAWSNGATTKNIGSLAPGSYTVTVTDSKGCVASNSFSVGSNVNCRTMEFTIDVFLEGPFESQNMLMQNKLRTQCNTVPLFQPYNTPAMGYAGTESVGNLGNDVVDWVLVSFRFNEDRTSEIYKTAALLSRDGKVRTIAGDTIFQVNASATDSLYVVVEHRNHMGVMTPAKMCADHANGNGVICVDFTHIQSYVTGSPATAGQKVLGTDARGTVYGMHSGDGDCNFDINSSDFVPFGTDFNKFDIYSPGDFNMDCDCNSNDLPLWLGNFNQFSGVR